MTIIEFLKNLTETFKTLKSRRETEKIFEIKFYAFFSALVGITFGVIIGLAVIIIQFGFPSFEDSALMSVIVGLSTLALLAFDVWLVYPLVIEKAIPIMEKVFAVAVTLILTIACLLLGIYGVFIVLALAIVYFILKVVFSKKY